jgi:enoyl-CoA hydratase/carnithine racemase
MAEPLDRRDDDGVAVLTLNRPDQLNTLSPELFLALRAAVDDIAASGAVGCVVIRGAGRSFCAGFDLKARERSAAMLAPDFGARLVDDLAALPQPVIAAVHGHCFTGGLELALAADFIIAAETARFADTHAKWGMRAAWGMTQRLPRRIGAPAAKDMMFTGRELNGREALALGLASRCVPDAELQDAALACARAVLERSGGVVRWIKDQVDRGADLTLAEALARETVHRPEDRDEMLERLRQGGWDRE